MNFDILPWSHDTQHSYFCLFVFLYFGNKCFWMKGRSWQTLETWQPPFLTDMRKDLLARSAPPPPHMHIIKLLSLFLEKKYDSHGNSANIRQYCYNQKLFKIFIAFFNFYLILMKTLTKAAFDQFGTN